MRFTNIIHPRPPKSRRQEGERCQTAPRWKRKVLCLTSSHGAPGKSVQSKLLLHLSGCCVLVEHSESSFQGFFFNSLVRSVSLCASCHHPIWCDCKRQQTNTACYKFCDVSWCMWTALYTGTSTVSRIFNFLQTNYNPTGTKSIHQKSIFKEEESESVFISTYLMRQIYTSNCCLFLNIQKCSSVETYKKNNNKETAS